MKSAVMQAGKRKAQNFNHLQYWALWSRGDSNPCPNISFKSFLHVYSGIDCREITGDGRTNYFLS